MSTPKELVATYLDIHIAMCILYICRNYELRYEKVPTPVKDWRKSRNFSCSFCSFCLSYIYICICTLYIQLIYLSEGTERGKDRQGNNECKRDTDRQRYVVRITKLPCKIYPCHDVLLIEKRKQQRRTKQTSAVQNKPPPCRIIINPVLESVFYNRAAVQDVPRS